MGRPQVFHTAASARRVGEVQASRRPARLPSLSTVGSGGTSAQRYRSSDTSQTPPGPHHATSVAARAVATTAVATWWPSMRWCPNRNRRNWLRCSRWWQPTAPQRPPRWWPGSLPWPQASSIGNLVVAVLWLCRGRCSRRSGNGLAVAGRSSRKQRLRSEEADAAVWEAAAAVALDAAPVADVASRCRSLPPWRCSRRCRACRSSGNRRNRLSPRLNRSVSM